MVCVACCLLLVLCFDLALDGRGRGESGRLELIEEIVGEGRLLKRANRLGDAMTLQDHAVLAAELINLLLTHRLNGGMLLVEV